MPPFCIWQRDTVNGGWVLIQPCPAGFTCSPPMGLPPLAPEFTRDCPDGVVVIRLTEDGQVLILCGDEVIATVSFGDTPADYGASATVTQSMGTVTVKCIPNANPNP